MPSAQAKQRRQEKRAAQGSPTKGGSRGDLGDDIARFNEDQRDLNQRRRDLQARIAERDTKSSMENIQRPTPHVQLGHQTSERRGSEAGSAAAHSKEDYVYATVAQSRPTGANDSVADRSSKGNAPMCTESHRQQASSMANRSRKGNWCTNVH